MTTKTTTSAPHKLPADLRKARLPASMKRWAFLGAAALPCALLLAFCGYTIHEWWLISTHQIAVVPAPARGATSVVEVPAARLVPVILGSALLAATFAYALLRGSRWTLLGGYLALGLLILAPLVRRVL